MTGSTTDRQEREERRPARILVTGSRTWGDLTRIRDELDAEAFAAAARGFIGVVVVHGTAPGADRTARDWARHRQHRGWPVQEEPHPADWGRLGRRAGMVRNQHMVKLGADVCLAFLAPCRQQRCRRPEVHPSHGARECADMADKAGIEVRRIYAACFDVLTHPTSGQVR